MARYHRAERASSSRLLLAAHARIERSWTARAFAHGWVWVRGDRGRRARAMPAIHNAITSRATMPAACDRGARGMYRGRRHRARLVVHCRPVAHRRPAAAYHRATPSSPTPSLPCRSAAPPRACRPLLVRHATPRPGVAQCAAHGTRRPRRLTLRERC